MMINAQWCCCIHRIHKINVVNKIWLTQAAQIYGKSSVVQKIFGTKPTKKQQKKKSWFFVRNLVNQMFVFRSDWYGAIHECVLCRSQSSVHVPMHSKTFGIKKQSLHLMYNTIAVNLGNQQQKMMIKFV